ncbi:molybdenum cofactor biosynthesis protein MoaE [Mucilaginibacter aquatilis]|uniref:Molybdopterin synthase catalytic subunit n=1 Tax=Mucilaginibacter aquatilis TaxID=1517760 RepID=A0A6I4IB12_9SPHI|nr:molybdenum cofactor biosynthesis protein MoaE [Mucilaginibacter aquatilis]MVN92302.1 molybdenum cofactor biosynthesis protein MoaE [Mucilaginibacter aquatilis]
MLIRLVEHIDLNEAFAYLNSPTAGAVNFFIGTVRNQTKGKEVLHLDFEAYDAMALTQMEKLANIAMHKWPLVGVAVIHATGAKQPGTPVVLIGVSSAHREASFEACRFLIDELKKSVPIWKKEYFEDNSVWVNAHP